MFTSKTIEETKKFYDTHLTKGLTGFEAERRRRVNGPNQLPEAKSKSLPAAFLDQLNDPLIYVLLAACAVSLLLNEVSDSLIILFVVIVNALIGLIQEGKAKKALESLQRLSSPHAIVIRDGRMKKINAQELVTGDLVVLEAGCQVPADLRLTETENLKAEESPLTGESLPVEKNSRFTAPSGKQELPLGDRCNMAYMSTVITNGRGKGIVTATGSQTEIGRIAALIHETKETLTPLQKRLGELGNLLSILSLILCGLLFSIAICQKRNLFEMLITAISLAVAAVPEGLPAVVTICLALSVTRMVRVNTIIRKLPSVETLGAVSLVCSDKTGTLTQNKMHVTCCFVNGATFPAHNISPSSCEDFLRDMVLCNDAVYDKTTSLGDPTELALLEFACPFGFSRNDLEKKYPRVKELPFDSERKMMTTLHKNGDSFFSCTKGAPDEILKKCTKIMINGQIVPLTASRLSNIRKSQETMAQKALRTLAIATKTDLTSPSEKDLIFLGMTGMQDPTRPEAFNAVKSFKKAGVDTVMITGDHVDTAYAIASQLAIVTDRSQCMTGAQLSALSPHDFKDRLKQVRVFARISPAQKVSIVKGFQEKGHIVAMTGDGINDAPSLKAADIGIAMGQNGTDVAKQAADMILTDDNFATIEKAIREGRGVYENIKKSIIFLLSSNLGEILTMFAAVACGLASPLKSSHILWINLITDSLPALALGIDNNDSRMLMSRPPRKKEESLFADGGLVCTCFYGALIAAISLTAFFLFPWAVMCKNHMHFSLPGLAALLRHESILLHAQTYAFTVLGMSQLFHALGMRNIHRSFFFTAPLRNRLMIAAFLFGFSLQFAVTEVPLFIRAFHTVHLYPLEWVFLILLSAFPLLAHELLVFFSLRTKA